MLRSPQSEQGDLREDLADWGGLKSLIYWLGIGGLGAVAILAAALGILLGGPLWDRDRRVFHGIAAWWGRSVMRLFPGQVELRGFERLPEGPCVIAANHQSMVDLLVLYLLPRQYRTVVKRALYLSPFGVNVWAAGYVPTPSARDPRGPRAVLEGCRAWLSRGYDVLIFPEGTRAKHWRLGRFKRGAFDIATAAGVPVVPVVIAGTNDILHRSSVRLCLRPLRIVLEVLEPLPPGEDGAKGLEARTREALGGRLDAVRAELFERYGQGPGPASG